MAFQPYQPHVTALSTESFQFTGLTSSIMAMGDPDYTTEDIDIDIDIIKEMYLFHRHCINMDDKTVNTSGLINAAVVLLSILGNLKKIKRRTEKQAQKK